MYFLDADNGNDGDGDDTDEEILNENEDSAQEQRSAYFNLIWPRLVWYMYISHLAHTDYAGMDLYYWGA